MFAGLSRVKNIFRSQTITQYRIWNDPRGSRGCSKNGFLVIERMRFLNIVMQVLYPLKHSRKPRVGSDKDRYNDRIGTNIRWPQNTRTRCKQQNLSKTFQCIKWWTTLFGSLSFLKARNKTPTLIRFLHGTGPCYGWSMVCPWRHKNPKLGHYFITRKPSLAIY